MERINNLYNFKNTVRHFINIENLTFDNISIEIDKLSWTAPIKFRVYKNVNKYRTLKLPNVLNFYAAMKKFETLDNLKDIQLLDSVHKRISPSLVTGDFLIGEYERFLQMDFENLCVYDNLIRLDIKEYYGRIYTHYLNLGNLNYEERYLTNMNLGATNGLLMGNYLSLYFAEKFSAQISQEIAITLEKANIKGEFSYFSDDFYFFCNREDNDRIIAIFDDILEKYDLERSDKTTIWTYETYNNYNVLSRYWKKTIANCNQSFRTNSHANNLTLINQMIYRISNIEDEKLKKVFITNIFKTKYFRNLVVENYAFKEYNYHQLCFLLGYSPEAILYSIDKFMQFKDFNKERLKKFMSIRYTESLKKDYNDEQLYYYYGLVRLGFNHILHDNKELVLESKNQLLITYYLREKIFDNKEIQILKKNTDEQYWFQNYHLILYTMDVNNEQELMEAIKRYLVPKRCSEEDSTCKENQTKLNRRNNYIKFYSDNLQSHNEILRSIDDVATEIKEYLRLRDNEAIQRYITIE